MATLNKEKRLGTKKKTKNKIPKSDLSTSYDITSNELIKDKIEDDLNAFIFEDSSLSSLNESMGLEKIESKETDTIETKNSFVEYPILEKNISETLNESQELEKNISDLQLSKSPRECEVEQPSAPAFSPCNLAKEIEVNPCETFLILDKVKCLQDCVKNYRLDQPIENKKCLSYDEVEMLYGSDKIELSRRFAHVFQLLINRTVYKDIIFFKKLMSYRDMIKMLDREKVRVENLIKKSDCTRECLWIVEKKTETSHGKCADNETLWLKVNYDHAHFIKEKSKICHLYYQEALNENVESFCLRQHNLYILRNKIEDMIALASSDENATKEYLQVMFHVLQIVNHDVNKTFVEDVKLWTYSLAAKMLCNSCLSNQLFIVHHLLRQSHNIAWAVPLLQPRVDNSFDIIELLCLLETILFPLQPNDCKDSSAQKSDGSAKDSEVWEVVETGAEWGGALDVDSGVAERSILLMLAQIPLKQLFRTLVFAEEDLNGKHSIRELDETQMLRVCGVARLLLQRLSVGMETHKKLPQLSSTLCKMTLHTLLYTYDARCLCAEKLSAEVVAELESVFEAGWRIFENCLRKEVSTEFISHMPFKILMDYKSKLYYDKILDTIDFSNPQECINQIESLVNIGLSAESNQFAADVIYNLFKIGFCSEENETKIGKKARIGLSILLRHTRIYYTLTLIQISMEAAVSQKPIKSECLLDLQLFNYQPSCAEITQLMEQWIICCPYLLPTLIDCLNINPPNGIPVDVQRTIAYSIVSYARTLSATKKPIPEWIYHKLTSLKLHSTSWNISTNLAPSGEEFGHNKYSNLDEDIPFCVFLLLATSLGHSVPLICDIGVPILIKIIEKERKAEAIHCLFCIMKVMLEAPESISVTPSFDLLLKSLIKSQSYVTRFWTTDNTETILVEAIEKHITETDYRSVEAWSQFLMLDGIGMKLLERLASKIVHRIELPLPASLDILETYGHSYPHISLRLVRNRHFSKELPMWPSLLSMLHMQRSGVVNVDEALKGLEGLGKSSDLAIYRAADAALQTSIGDPAHVLLWDFFFQLYRQAAPTCRPDAYLPVGPLFYRGFKISMTLSRMKKRIQETLAHHENEVKNNKTLVKTLEKDIPMEKHKTEKDILSDKFNYSSDSFEDIDVSRAIENHELDRGSKLRNAQALISYHQTVVKYMQCYLTWLEEDKSNVPLPNITQTNDILRCPILLTPYFIEELNRIEKIRGTDVENQIPMTSNKNETPGSKILNRLKTYKDPQRAEDPKPLIRIQIPSGNYILDDTKQWILELKQAASDFIREKSVTELYNITLFDPEYMPALYYSKPFTQSAKKSCGKQCTGEVLITVKGVEWVKSSNVAKQISDVLGRRNAASNSLQRPRPQMAELATRLLALTSYVTDKKIANDIFWQIANSINSVEGCPPVSDTLKTAALKLAKNANFNDNILVSIIKGDYGESMIRIATEIARDKRQSYCLYTGILRADAPVAITYSIISKFSIYELVEELTSREINDLLDAQLESLGNIGAEPSHENLPLQELVCLQVGCLLRARPFCSSACVRGVAKLASEGHLSREAGEALMNCTAAVASQLETHQVIGFCMDLGTIWRENEAWKRNSEHAHISASLVFAVLQILTKKSNEWQACIQCVWSSWEAWTGGANTRHFLDIILQSYPDSRNAILQYWLISMSRLWSELSGRDIRELNVTAFADDSSWYHVNCLSALVMMSAGKMELRSWLASAVRGINAVSWVPHGSGVQELLNVFHILTTLPVHEEMIKDAANNLPWDLLSEEQFGRLLHDYLIKHHENADPCFFRTTFKLICGAGLRPPRVLTFVSRWTLILTSSGGFRSGVAPLLSHITAAFNIYCKECSDVNSQLAFGESLLGQVIVILSVHPFSEQYLPEFVGWVSSAPHKLVRVMLRVICEITLLDIFLQLSEKVIDVFLANGGTWAEVFNSWTNSCFVPEALSGAQPLTMAATLLSSNVNQQVLSLDRIQLTIESEPQVCVAIWAFVRTITDANQSKALANSFSVSAKLRAWSSPPPSLLTRALTLNRSPAMSPRLRAASAMAVACIESVDNINIDSKRHLVEGYENVLNEFYDNLSSNSAKTSALAIAYSRIFQNRKDLFCLDGILG